MGCRIKDNLRGVCVDHRGLPFIRVLCEDGTTVKVTYLSHVDEFFYGRYSVRMTTDYYHARALQAAMAEASMEGD
jgi:hypothetical protein